MAFSEGTTSYPQDSQNRFGQGYLGDEGNLWHPRRDANGGLRVALWGANNEPLLTASNPGLVRSIGSNEVVHDGDITYTASTAAATAQNLAINHPSSGHHSALCYVAITNPSTASVMNLTFQNKETFSFDGSPEDVWVTVSTTTIPANTPNGMVFLVQGWLMGDAQSRLLVSNVSQIEGSNVVLHVKVRRV